MAQRQTSQPAIDQVADRSRAASRNTPPDAPRPWAGDYKVEAHELATTILGCTQLESLAASGAFGEICHRAMQVVNKTNLIFPNEKMDLKDGLKPAGRQREFALALYGLLHGEDDLPSRFQRFAAVLEDMGAGKWTVATYFPFLLFPDDISSSNRASMGDTVRKTT